MTRLRRIVRGLGFLCCVFALVDFGEGEMRSGVWALTMGVGILLVSWRDALGLAKVSPQVQGLVFFAGGGIFGVAVLVLTITGTLKDPVVGLGGGVAAVLSICALVKGRGFIRSDRSTNDSEH